MGVISKVKVCRSADSYIWGLGGGAEEEEGGGEREIGHAFLENYFIA